MAMSASDKKDDKKDEKKDKGHQPILIVVWEQAWTPIFREVSEVGPFETGLVLPEEIQ